METIEVIKRPAKADRNAVGKGLGEYNRAAYGRLRGAERWILARDAAGVLQAGAKCDVSCGWLYLDWLWVAEGRRGQDLGTRMLAEVEALARERGCQGVHLNTWSFQAPGFYAKRGYAEVGRLADHPPGATRHWFAKRFATAG